MLTFLPALRLWTDYSSLYWTNHLTKARSVGIDVSNSICIEMMSRNSILAIRQVLVGWVFGFSSYKNAFSIIRNLKKNIRSVIHYADLCSKFIFFVRIIRSVTREISILAFITDYYWLLSNIIMIISMIFEGFWFRFKIIPFRNEEV